MSQRSDRSVRSTHGSEPGKSTRNVEKTPLPVNRKLAFVLDTPATLQEVGKDPESRWWRGTFGKPVTSEFSKTGPSHRTTSSTEPLASTTRSRQRTLIHSPLANSWEEMHSGVAHPRDAEN
ncbi:hypothetical protein ACS0TY_026983 [Phlomoides rotata]